MSATFTDAALNIAGSHEFTVEAAEPTRLVIVSAPETGTVRAALVRTRVALRDAFGNTPLMPQYSGLSTANGRGGAGPWTLEMGVKVTVSQPASLEAV